jgi:hypothetical protein
MKDDIAPKIEWLQTALSISTPAIRKVVIKVRLSCTLRSLSMLVCTAALTGLCQVLHSASAALLAAHSTCVLRCTALREKCRALL